MLHSLGHAVGSTQSPFNDDHIFDTSWTNFVATRLIKYDWCTAEENFIFLCIRCESSQSWAFKEIMNDNYHVKLKIFQHEIELWVFLKNSLLYA